MKLNTKIKYMPNWPPTSILVALHSISNIDQERGIRNVNVPSGCQYGEMISNDLDDLRSDFSRTNVNAEIKFKQGYLAF